MNTLGLRHTGRSQRMLVQAVIEVEKNHRAVYVMAASHGHAKQLKRMLDDLWPPPYHNIRIEGYEQFPTFDWKTMTIPGAHPNVLVLVDHYTIERLFTPMLEMLHAFDDKDEK